MGGGGGRGGASSTERCLLTVDYGLLRLGVGVAQRAVGVNELMYVAPWFMRMFTCFEPWPTAMHMFDHCLLHGSC